MRLDTVLDEALVEQTRPPSPTVLWVSDIGNCPRAVMFRVLGQHSVTHPFDVDLLDVMQLGRYVEQATAELLCKRLGANNVANNVSLGNNIWSGRADFIINVQTGTVIMEHKATGAKWFDYQASLPKEEHAAQVLMYQHLYGEQYGIKPPCYLMYRAWQRRASFRIQDEGNYILASGYLKRNSPRVARRRNFNLTEQRHALERLYKERVLPDRPWGSPTQPGAKCTFRGDPSCRYYGHCWP